MLTQELYYSASEAAQLLKIKRTTLYNKVSKGEIHVYRPGIKTRSVSPY